MRARAHSPPARAQDSSSPLFSRDEPLLQHPRGDPAAPNLFIEYASLTCPHCARFHAEIYPRLEREWIATGRIYFLYRHFPLDGVAARAALLAECMPSDDAFYAFTELLFRSQSEWARSEAWREALINHAALAGVGREAAEACMDDEAVLTQMAGEFDRAASELGVRGTPSLFFNAERVRSGGDPEVFFQTLSRLALDA